jgi:hypothetical protein
MANLLTKLTEVGKVAGVERSNLSMTEWSAKIKQALGREGADIGDLYKEAKDGKLKGPAKSEPVQSKSVDAKPAPVTEISKPVRVEVLPPNHKTEVDARHEVAFHLPAVTVRIDTPTFGGGEATLLGITTKVLSWGQAYALGFLSALVLGRFIAKSLGGL